MVWSLSFFSFPFSNRMRLLLLMAVLLWLRLSTTAKLLPSWRYCKGLLNDVIWHITKSQVCYTTLSACTMLILFADDCDISSSIWLFFRLNFAEFRFLKRLFLVHRRHSYNRTAHHFFLSTHLASPYSYFSPNLVRFCQRWPSFCIIFKFYLSNKLSGK